MRGGKDKLRRHQDTKNFLGGTLGLRFAHIFSSCKRAVDPGGLGGLPLNELPNRSLFGCFRMTYECQFCLTQSALNAKSRIMEGQAPPVYIDSGPVFFASCVKQRGG